MSQNGHAEPEFDVVVTERRDEAEDVVVLRLARPDGAGMPELNNGNADITHNVVLLVHKVPTNVPQI